MIDIYLKEIANVLNYEIDFNKKIENITTDSRNIKKESVFIALKGDNFDGNDYIKEAFLKGAIAVVCSKKIAGLKDSDLCFYVEDTRLSYLMLASYYKKKSKIKSVGVTGTVGKTTTKDMIASVLSKSFKTMKTEKNFNNEIGVSDTLFKIKKEDEMAVIEMGMDRKGDIDILARAVKPDVAVVTLIGEGHMEFLGSIENILKEKLSILNGMDKNSPIILNIDNKYLNKAVKTIINPVITYGIKNEEADFRAVNIHEEYENFTTNYELIYNKKTYNVAIPTIGIHNVTNSLAAIATAVLFKLDIKKSIQGLKDYKPTGMRQNIVKKFDITFIEDCYNSSPDSVEAALLSLSSMTIKKEGKKIAVIGDMYELGENEEKHHDNIANIFNETNIDYLVLVGELTKNTYKKAKSLGIKNVYYYKNKDTVFEKIKSILSKDDIILFKASRGMKLEKIISNLYDYLK